eukprot:TRINITY_DN17058_c0_g1_i1.p1 TRINITY_DN17058_c0_g1~~TRINITY_DN17058_c0_g1_i1.p1  ORF type:complete len:200 (-),score=15.98 TRINITY_DN17058_c0_g1_i1:58-657(-)
MNTLPRELVLIIFGYLDIREICSASTVNRLWSTITLDRKLWKNLFQSTFNDIPEHSHKKGSRKKQRKREKNELYWKNECKRKFQDLVKFEKAHYILSTDSAGCLHPIKHLYVVQMFQYIKVICQLCFDYRILYYRTWKAVRYPDQIPDCYKPDLRDIGTLKGTALQKKLKEETNLLESVGTSSRLQLRRIKKHQDISCD